MNRRTRSYASIAAALGLLTLLVWRTIAFPPPAGVLVPGVLFCLLVIFTTTFGVPLGGGRMSLVPMTAVAAYLVVGLVPAIWVVILGALSEEVIRYLWAERLGMRRETDLLSILGLGAANVLISAGSILASGAVFAVLGGTVPLTAVTLPLLPPLLLLGLTYLAANYLIAGLYIAARSRKALRLYGRSLPNLLLYEGAPLVFAPLMAMIYTGLGLPWFILFAAVLVLASLIIHNLSITSQRLERRVKELGSLQAVGQALSASLDLGTILEAIYRQVSELMPAQNFYVALYEPDSDEVSFPLAIEDGRPVHWSARRAGNGLSEYVLRTRAPLLIRSDVANSLKQLGVVAIGRPAASWLGVPICAGQESLGVIAVQSFSPDELYDEAHREVLVTIATQAAVAIQNAHLYARTDQALARRVQELDSILRTAQEGILLLDTAWRILAANRTLSDFLGLSRGELTGSLRAAVEGENPVLARMEYTTDTLAVDCQALLQEESAYKRQTVLLPGPPERPVERTLTPVRDQQGTVTGWLIVLRDLTEERELARLREEMTHLLIHDLRSPLTVMQGSLGLIERLLRQENYGELPRLLAMAQHGNEQLLDMINQLLDISRLESAQISLRLEPIAVSDLLQRVAERFAPLAQATGLDLQVEVEPDLPPLQADVALIGRVLSNLVDNAIKFTPNGGQVRLWARRASPDSPAGILLGVRDTGPGIPAEYQGQLFKKFLQIQSQASRRRGTGLGLYFCRLVANSHGGQIWVESQAGQGSNFILRLPLETGR